MNIGLTNRGLRMLVLRFLRFSCDLVNACVLCYGWQFGEDN